MSTDHLIAVGHISASVFVLLCLFSIVSVHYGDLLIKYFKLEDKFPRLAKYIRLRRLFQEYYFIFNVLLIVLILLYIIYMNCSMLLLR